MKRSLLAVAAAVSIVAATAFAQQAPTPAPAQPGPGMGPMHGPMGGPMGGPAHAGMHGGPGGFGPMSQFDTNKDGKLSKDEAIAWFDRLDTNKDGFLSPEELAAARAQFAGHRMDVDGNGLISREEAKNFPMLAQNFDAIDANKDGQLSRDEMRAYHEAHRGEAWARLDANKDGMISREEAKGAPRLSSNFDALDTNKDGQLSQEELRSAWAGRGHRHGARMDTNADGLISREEAKNSPVLLQNFDAIDANKDGVLSRDEIHAWRRAQNSTATAPVKP